MSTKNLDMLLVIHYQNAVNILAIPLFVILLFLIMNRINLI